MGHKCTTLIARIISTFCCRCGGEVRQQQRQQQDDDSGISSDDDMLYTRDMILIRNSVMCDVYNWIINNISADGDQHDDGRIVTW